MRAHRPRTWQIVVHHHGLCADSAPPRRSSVPLHLVVMAWAEIGSSALGIAIRSESRDLGDKRVFWYFHWNYVAAKKSIP